MLLQDFHKKGRYNSLKMNVIHVATSLIHSVQLHNELNYIYRHANALHWMSALKSNIGEHISY